MATILRHGVRPADSADQAAQPATFTFSDMASQGTAYVQTVRGEAVKEVQQAKAEADKIRKKAEADGKAAAESTLARLVDEKLAAELVTLRPALDAVAGELDASRSEWQTHWRRSAVHLAVAIAERIVRRELRDDPSISEAWLTEALELAAGASEITVRLAPENLEHLRGHAEKLAESMAGLGETRFVADPQITPGGCRVETRHGSVDQQLQTQLERLEEELS